ncbi:MAG: hypothetical protein E7545_01725 [Ruminococcaceae bacterium]|nr:hypothetical protein [Oscillospiraceae bacterium]
MKKFLSILLSATLIVTCLLSIPFTSSAANAALPENLVKTDTVKLFDATDEKWSSTNPWLVKANTNGSQTYAWVEYDVGPHIKSGQKLYSKNILSQAGAADTSVDNFVWNFKTYAENVNWYSEAFYFNVNDNSTVQPANSTTSAANTFAVYFGGRNTSSADLVGVPIARAMCSAFTVLVPKGTDGKLAPLTGTTTYSNADSVANGWVASTDTTTTITAPKEGSYLSLMKDGTNLLSEALTNKEWMDVTLALAGGKLTITIVIAGETLTQTFDISGYINIAPEGDFAVATGGANGRFMDMSITTTYTEVTTPESGLMFDSSKITDDTAWLGSNVSGKNITYSNGVATIPGTSITTPILKENGYTDTNLTDFVWEFEFKTKNDLAQPSFYFHLDENRTTNTTVWPTTGSRGGIKYVLGSTLYGESDPTIARDATNAKDKNFNVRQDAFTSILRIDVAYTTHTPAQYYTTSLEEYYASNATETGKRKPVSYVDFKSKVDSTVTDTLKVGTYYTVRFVMTGNTLLTEVWQSDAKADTYNSIVTAFTDAQMAYAPSGDFGILAANGSSSIDVKNMKIYKGVSHLVSTEDYSEYKDYETAYTFDEDTEALTFKIDDSKNQGVSATQSDGKLALFAGENGNITINNIDGGNKNLGDFIAKWDITDDNHNWATERMSFRKNGSNYWYRLSISEAGLSNTTAKYDTLKYTYLTLEKKNGADSEEVLAQYPISAGLMNGVEMTIKLEVIGNTIKVWFGNAGYDMAAPVITYTDTEPLTTGYMEYYHSKDSAGKYTYIDNFYIYDLTAKAIADEVAGIDASKLTCNDKGTYADLTATMKDLNESQTAKLTDTIAAWNNTILPALDHKLGAEVIDPKATYFTAGTSTKTCGECNTPFTTTIPATDKALDSITETFADGKLTIAWEYNEDLIVDIANGAKIYFNYEILGYKNSVLVPGTEALSVTLEGFNADRLNAELTYFLSAEYAAVEDTSKLKTATTNTVKAASISTDTELNALLSALDAATGEAAVVAGQVDNTDTLVSNTMKADLKAGTLDLRFVASQTLIEKLNTLGKAGRTVTLTVTIGDTVTKDITIDTLKKVTMVKITGMSFEQLNSIVTVKLGFAYADAANNFATDVVEFDCGKIIDAADTAASNAFEAYMAK